MWTRVSQRVLALTAGAVCALAVGAGSASAGEWMQASCQNPDGSPAPMQGWAPAISPSFSPPMNVYEAGACLQLTVFGVMNTTSTSDYATFRYTPPAGSSLAGGSLVVTWTGNEDAYPEAYAPDTSPWNMFWAGSGYGVTDAVAQIPSGVGGDLTVGAFGSGGSLPLNCVLTDCILQVNRAELLLRDSNLPQGINFGGSLLGAGAVHGTSQLTFVATDPSGPGIYQVTVRIDGHTAYQATPNTNGGECRSFGTDPTSGAWVFDSQQPCPQTVDVDVPVNTTTLRDGEHELQVAVEDAAQNTSNVLDQPFTTRNLATVASTTDEGVVVAPSAAGATPSYAFKLDPASARLTGATERRRFTHSALTLSGVVLSATGAPAPNVSVALESGTPTGAGFTAIAHGLTDGQGRFRLTVPRGDSRTLRLIAGIAQVAFTQVITPDVSLRVRSRHGQRLTFSGRIAIDQQGGPQPLVQIEDRTPTGWQPLASLTASKTGSFRYVYRSSPLTIGYRFAFRAVTPPTVAWRGGASRAMHATVRR